MTSKKFRAVKRVRRTAAPDFTAADFERAGFELHPIAVVDRDGLERREWIWAHPLGDETGERALPGSTVWSATRITSFAFRRTVVREAPRRRLGRRELSTHFKESES